MRLTKGGLFTSVETFQFVGNGHSSDRSFEKHEKQKRWADPLGAYRNGIYVVTQLGGLAVVASTAERRHHDDLFWALNVQFHFLAERLAQRVRA